jgi:phospholipase C
MGQTDPNRRYLIAATSAGMTDDIGTGTGAGNFVADASLPLPAAGTIFNQENPPNVALGEALLAKVVNALGASPLWPRALFVFLYDEHGGYYDHVPPPPAS